MQCWNCKEDNDDADECCGACGESLSAADHAQPAQTATAPPATVSSVVASTVGSRATAQEAPAQPKKPLFPAPGRSLFPAPTGPNRPPVVGIQSGCECGAPATAIQQDGDGSRICTSCGAKAINPERDDFYIQAADKLLVRSNIGRKHETNQDYGTAGQLTVAGKPVSWWVVSDGISRAEKSEQASQGACTAADDTIRQALASGRKDAQGVVDRAIRAAQKSVLSIPISPETLKPDSPLQPPGATIVVALVMDGTITVGWLGDSRAYLLTKKATGELKAAGELKVSLITRDHSYINYLLDVEGKSLAEALATAGKDLHAITRCLGLLERGVDLEPSFVSLPTEGAVCLLGCSDGFWNYAHPQQDQPAEKIVELVNGKLDDPLQMANDMINFANGSGGVDNITVCLLTL